MVVDEVINVGMDLRVAMPPHCACKALSPQCRPTVLIRRSPQQSCDVRFADKHSVSAGEIGSWCWPRSSLQSSHDNNFRPDPRH